MIDMTREIYSFGRARPTLSRIISFRGGAAVETRIDGVAADKIRGVDAQSAFDYAFLRSSGWKKTSEESAPVRIADMFCGCGGLSLGAREACYACGLAFESILAIDKDSASLEVYKANFLPFHAYARDVWEIVDGKANARLTANEFRLRNSLGSCDILLAGPPCQGHSNLNNHTRRNDQRNRLYERVGRVARVIEPEHILVENVPGVTNCHEKVLEDTIDTLVNAGYKVDEAVVDLFVLGVPQKRKRHVLLASRTNAFSIAQVISAHSVCQTRDVRWAIGDLENCSKGEMLDMPTLLSDENRRRIRYLQQNHLFDLPNKLRPRCQQGHNHSYKSMYGRQKFNEPAQTITGGFRSPGQGRYIHPTQPRTFTPHEAARLQFFPDSFDFSPVPTRNALANMIGNAVPMKLSYVFCLEFIARWPRRLPKAKQ